MATGRFAPSPTGALHLGNLRTALVAWLAARTSGGRFLVRMEDLDPVVARREHEAGQLADLAALGLDWDGVVVRQSTRADAYGAAISRLAEQGLVYPCFCSRREIRAAVSAPHGSSPDGAYPGTCRKLTPDAVASMTVRGRRPALRLRTTGKPVTVTDILHGPYTAAVDDFVLRRQDGMSAYNLAVVVDDAAQGVEQVVRADDLLPSTPRQVYLARLLGLPAMSYLHIPLVLGPTGQRLAKRDGAVTLADRMAIGETADEVRAALALSLGLCLAGERPSMADLLAVFDAGSLPRSPWVFAG